MDTGVQHEDIIRYYNIWHRIRYYLFNHTYRYNLYCNTFIKSKCLTLQSTRRINHKSNCNDIFTNHCKVCFHSDKNKYTISKHIKKIFDSWELDKTDSVAKNATELNITDYRKEKNKMIKERLNIKM